MNQEHNQEREQADRKFRGMFATTKALKEKGSSALDTSPRQSGTAKWVDRISLIGGILIAGWLIFIILYGLREVLVEIGIFLTILPFLVLLTLIVYAIGRALGLWNKNR